MLALTPAERRGALTLAFLLLVGTCWDLVRAHAPAVALPPDTLNVAPRAADTVAAAPGAPSAPGAVPSRVNLNRADFAALDALPGIGPVLARRILDHRAAHGPFQHVEDLLAVPGIGPALYARLAPLVVAGR